MARTRLDEHAHEKSTYVVTLTFTDAAGASVTPDTVTWSLTTVTGTAINGRTNVVATPAASVKVVLSGLDLAMQAGESELGRRLLTVEATYTSTEGAGLPLKEEYEFFVYPLVKVT